MESHVKPILNSLSVTHLRGLSLHPTITITLRSVTQWARMVRGGRAQRHLASHVSPNLGATMLMIIDKRHPCLFARNLFRTGLPSHAKREMRTTRHRLPDPFCNFNIGFLCMNADRTLKSGPKEYN